MKTPIQEAIGLIDDYTDIYCTSEGATFSYLTPEGVKSLLESMLEKEQESHVEFAKKFNANYDLSDECIEENTEGGRFCINRMSGLGKCQLCLDIERVFTETFNNQTTEQ